MTYFLDTNICIHILNESSQNVVDRFEKIGIHRIAVPAVVAAELMYGAHKSAKYQHNLKRFHTFLNQFTIAGLSSAAIEAHGKIRSDLERKGTPIGANDYYIAASPRQIMVFS